MKPLAKIFFVVALFAFADISNAQVNLVPNPSFEVYDTCPSNNILYVTQTYYPGIVYAAPWFQPNIIQNSLEYFNECDTNINFLDIPYNYEGYQFARTGTGYAGFALGYILPQNNVREYVEVKLIDSLIANKKYCASFFVNFSNISKTSVDAIGVYFSRSRINNSAFSVLNFNPQVQNVQGNIITDTLNWTEISGEFYAVGGEQYITIGNFKDDAHTGFIRNTYGIHNYSYYYIDDVSVTLCDSTVGIEENNFENNNFTVSPNPSNGVFELSFDKKIKSSSAIIKVYSLQGSLIYSAEKEISNSKINLSLENISAGIYFVEVNFDKDFSLRKRIVIVK